MRASLDPQRNDLADAIYPELRSTRSQLDPRRSHPHMRRPDQGAFGFGDPGATDAGPGAFATLEHHRVRDDLPLEAALGEPIADLDPHGQEGTRTVGGRWLGGRLGSLSLHSITSHKTPPARRPEL